MENEKMKNELANSFFSTERINVVPRAEEAEVIEREKKL